MPYELQKAVEYIVRFYANNRSYSLSTDFFAYFENLLGSCAKKICLDIPDRKARLMTQGKVLRSAMDKTPYRFVGETFCGENKFYTYRRELFVLIAKSLGLIDGKED